VQGNERWKELCEQASKEQDPKKLVKLIQEISSLLEAKRHRLEDGNSREAVDRIAVLF
jgi:hypothetical protein